MRPSVSILTAVLVTAGCTASLPLDESFAPLLPDFEPDSFRFFHGSWIAPDATYAFQLTSDSLYAVDDSTGEEIVRSHTLAACPEIATLYAGLKSAVLRTAEIAAGAVAVEEPDTLILDGADYRIEYWSRDASTTLILKGDDNAQLVSPWLDAALAVRSVAAECGAD